MNYHNNVNKYVCPNDRQLQLRAKLRTGWSAARSQPPLTASERECIAAVVARAERLEALEARRVGRLVARAARAAAGRAPAPGGCTLCGRRARLLAPLRVCALCAAPVCGKCVIENGANRDQYLCNICAETRELWKKSGAWFFKSLPAYILPEKRLSGRYDGAAESATQHAETDVSNPLPEFSRQSSAAESYKGTGPSYQEPNQLDSWTEIETLHHGISALSLNRAESFSQKSGVSLKRSSSKGSAYSLRNYRKEIQKPPITPPADKTTPSLGSDAGLGTLEIRLFYDNSTSSLACTVMRARGLPGMDIVGLSDPFCRLDILPTEGTCSNRLRTKTVHKTKNPEFNETLNFYGITETDLSSKSLQIKVFDDDRYGCDIMGSTTVALRDLAIRGSIQQDLKLALSADLEPPDSLPKPQILLSLSYNTKRRALVVTVCRCTNLPPMDSNGYSDPFIKLHLDPDPAHKKHKTSIKWRNLNPVYNEEFHFETRPTELTKQNLTLTVWDKDYGKPNDFLGSLLIGSSSKGKRLKHWLDCIRFPDHRHEQWHCLTDTEHL